MRFAVWRVQDIRLKLAPPFRAMDPFRFPRRGDKRRERLILTLSRRLLPASENGCGRGQGRQAKRNEEHEVRPLKDANQKYGSEIKNQ